MRFMAWQYRHCVLCNNERLLKLYALLILRICNTKLCITVCQAKGHKNVRTLRLCHTRDFNGALSRQALIFNLRAKLRILSRIKVVNTQTVEGNNVHRLRSLMSDSNRRFEVAPCFRRTLSTRTGYVCVFLRTHLTAD